MKKVVLYFSVSILLLLIIVDAYSYDNEYVHQKININASLQSNNFFNTMNNLGFNALTSEELLEIYVAKKRIKIWVEEGARLEDETDCRSKFHFHDPTKSWDSAGLSNTLVDTYCLDYKHRSSLMWAQNADNLWTWQKARQYYFEALTYKNKDVREQRFAYTFRSLGQVMHLIADSSVPAHTRNDIHVFPYTIPKIDITVGNPTFESWTRDNYKDLTYAGKVIDQSIFSQAVFNSSAPVAISALWDQDKYIGSNPDITVGITVGLTEYSNANFFSEDTIFTDFSFPAWSSVVEYDEVIDSTSGKARTYLKKIKDGETINHLAAGKWFYKYLPFNLKSPGLKLDEMVYSDYAQKLIPRAVGYSAGLVNYFFRGTLEISAPDQYVYSLIDGSKIPRQFTKIKAKVINTTPGEDIQNGVIQTVAKYRKRTNYQPDLSADPPTAESREADFSYSISAPITLTPEAITSLNTQPTEFTFDFTDPIPAGITDLSFFVIFKGTLGNETDNAIAVGMKDLKEPTHHVFWNLTDMFSLDGHLYTSNQIQADPNLASLVDLDHDRVFSEPGEPYIYSHEMTFEIAYMAESPPADPVYASAKVTDLPDGRYIRLIVLVDDELTYNYVRLAWWVTLPDRELEVGDNDYIFEGVTSQEENGVWQPPTSITTFRTVRQHFNQGILRCEPIMEDPVTGNHYCAYPEEEAIIPADLSPYPATIYFP